MVNEPFLAEILAEPTGFGYLGIPSVGKVSLMVELVILFVPVFDLSIVFLGPSGNLLMLKEILGNLHLNLLFVLDIGHFLNALHLFINLQHIHVRKHPWA